MRGSRRRLKALAVTTTMRLVLKMMALAMSTMHWYAIIHAECTHKVVVASCPSLLQNADRCLLLWEDESVRKVALHGIGNKGVKSARQVSFQTPASEKYNILFSGRF